MVKEEEDLNTKIICMK
jgi:hypothetical protein